jgi:hypothetical protein
MNESVTLHEPTPEFLAHLEWQIETALRRETRLNAPTSSRLWRFRSVLVAVAALLVGAVAGMAPGFAQESRERDQLLETAKVEQSLANMRLDLAHADYDGARRRVDAGTADRETLLAAEEQVRTMETRVAHIQLDIDEIRATSAAPRNELDAPLVGTRDFVKERLTLDLQAAERALTASEQELARQEKRWDIGMISQPTLLQAQTDVADARSRIELVKGTLDLRQRALRGEIKSVDLGRARRRLELTLEANRLDGDLTLAHAQVEEARRRLGAGQGADVDLKRAELHVAERQLALQHVQQELRALGVKK